MTKYSQMSDEDKRNARNKRISETIQMLRVGDYVTTPRLKEVLPMYKAIADNAMCVTEYRLMGADAMRRVNQIEEWLTARGKRHPTEIGDVNWAEQFVGLRLSAAEGKAEQLGWGYRVTSQDGRHPIVTRDHRPYDRINFTVENNAVTDISFG